MWIQLDSLLESVGDVCILQYGQETLELIQVTTFPERNHTGSQSLFLSRDKRRSAVTAGRKSLPILRFAQRAKHSQTGDYYKSSSSGLKAAETLESGASNAATVANFSPCDHAAPIKETSAWPLSLILFRVIASRFTKPLEQSSEFKGITRWDCGSSSGRRRHPHTHGDGKALTSRAPRISLVVIPNER
jgi:hypothetical protein